MYVIIPAYEPDQRLMELSRQLRIYDDIDLLVIDDGSGESYQQVFQFVENMGAKVLFHEFNLGKGAALKTAFKYLKQIDYKGSIVTADSDGQHLVSDIRSVSEQVNINEMEMVLGVREFSGDVPFKSKFGNNMTRWIFKLSTGVDIQDTQTGLRGFSHLMLDWLLSVEGSRFEYEMNMLLEATKADILIEQVPIVTVYIENNESTHFRPIIDSMKVYLPFLKYSIISVLSGILDFVLLFIFNWMSVGLFASVMAARAISSMFNYFGNKTVAFSEHKKEPIHKSIWKYYGLVVVVLLLNYFVLALQYEVLGIPLLIAKIVTEVVVFFFSYTMQRRFVFRKFRVA